MRAKSFLVFINFINPLLYSGVVTSGGRKKYHHYEAGIIENWIKKEKGETRSWLCKSPHYGTYQSLSIGVSLATNLGE